MMKQKRTMYILVLCLLLALSVALVACGDGKNKISLDKTTLTLTVGQSETLTVSGAEGTVEWTSSDAAVATVTNGEVTAVSAGTAVITATADGAEAKCTVTVEAAEYPLTLVLSHSSVELKVEEEVTLIATALQNNSVVEATFTYTSENTEIVTAENGKLVGIAPGTTNVQVKATYQDSEATQNVPVTVRLDAEIELASEKFLLSVLKLDDTDNNTASADARLLEKGNETPADFTYESDNEEVFTVDNDGTLTAVGVGTANLTVTTTISGSVIEKTVTVEVVKTQVKDFTVDFGTYNRAMLNAEKSGYSMTQEITANVEPYAEGLSLEWISSSSMIVTVEGNGLTATVTAVEGCLGGEATVALYIEGEEVGRVVIGVYFPISTEKDLIAIDDTEQGLTYWYLLTNDIELQEVYDYAVVTQFNDSTSSWKASFKGVFDGNGYTVSNLRLGNSDKGDWNAGLFGYNRGIIRNVRVEVVVYRSETDPGRSRGIRNKSGAIAAQNSGTVENCMVYADMIIPNQKQSGGGVVGVLSESGVVRNCYSEVTIQRPLDSYNISTDQENGAIVGCLWGGKMENCWSVKKDDDGKSGLYVDYIKLYGNSSLGDQTAAATAGCYVETSKEALINDGFGTNTFDSSLWNVIVSDGTFEIGLKPGNMLAPSAN